MDIRLCNDEQVVKSWDYATEGGLFNKSVANVTVTNKRIISSVQGRKKINRAEVPVEAVKRVNVVSTAQISLYTILFLALGILLIVGYFALELTMPCMIVGAIFVIIGVLLLLFYRKRAFKLSITITPSEVVGISAGRTTQKKVNKRQKSVRGAKKSSSMGIVLVVLAVFFIYLLSGMLGRNGDDGASGGFGSVMMLSILFYAIIILSIVQLKMKKGHKKVKIAKTVSHTKGLKLHFDKEAISEISNEIGAVVLNAKALKE